MTDMSKHASKRNHPWFLFVIAVPAAVEVWACWVGLGSLCGFPVIGRNGHGIPTNWTLAVGLEAYGAYALKVWLGSAPGPRSRKFAQWSSLGAFTLSLIGQVSYHLMLAAKMTRAPAVVIVFVACLVVVVIGFAAILTHLMHADERAAVNAGEERTLQAALADERDARLRAEDEREAALRDRDATEQERAELAVRLEAAQQQLAQAAQGRNKGRTVPPRRSAAPRGTKSPEGQAAEVVIRAEAELILAAEPDISGSELGRRLNVQPGYGRRLKRELTQATQGGGG